MEACNDIFNRASDLVTDSTLPAIGFQLPYVLMNFVYSPLCLEKLSDLFADTQDSQGRYRFLHCSLMELYDKTSFCINETRDNDF